MQPGGDGKQTVGLRPVVSGLGSGRLEILANAKCWVINKSRVMQEAPAMESKEQQLMELLGLTARSLTHLTASMTSMSFELLRSDDQVTRDAGRRMIDRMATISAGLDEHWRLIGELTGVHVAHEQIETIQEIQLQAPPRLPSS
jgi:hypothetical protein